MDETYVCPCGLVCLDCLFARHEVYETARRLRSLLAESQLDVFLGALNRNETMRAMAEHLRTDERELEKRFAVFARLPELLDLLEGLGRLECRRTCQEAGGCSVGGTTRACSALGCLRQKGYQGCWECGDWARCAPLEFLRRSYGETLADNLRIAREQGVAAVPARGNRYYAWQRRNPR